MQDPFEETGADRSFADSFAMLNELEANKPEAIRKLRADERISVKTKVIIQPGNAGDLQRMRLQGVTGDISRSGCLVLVPTPLLVGDIYRLTFDREVLDLPMLFARCLRCRLIREHAFESGFSFFAPVELPQGIAHGTANHESAA
jgi:hypothetical protein